MNSITSTSIRKNAIKAATIPIINPAFEEPAVDLKKRGGDFVEFDFKFLELDVKVVRRDFEFTERGVEVVELNVEFDVKFVEGDVEIVEFGVGFDVKIAKHGVEILEIDFPRDKRAVAKFIKLHGFSLTVSLISSKRETFQVFLQVIKYLCLNEARERIIWN